MSLRSKIFISIWLGVVAITSTYLGLWHNSDFSVEKKLSKIFSSGKQDWGVYHFLAGECGCSSYVVDYLVKRGPSDQAYEEIRIFDDIHNFTEKLSLAGFTVKNVLRESFQEKDLPTGMPLLVITNPKDKVVYEGGYSNRMIGVTTQFQDLFKLAELKKDERTKTLPAYGCYISKKYQRLLDPIGFKYK